MIESTSSRVGPCHVRGSQPDKAVLDRTLVIKSGAGHFRLIHVLSACVLSIILMAGLWPFHTYRNQVEWLKNRNGLQFKGYGSILSSNSFHANASNNDNFGSIEIWLQPENLRGSYTILSFDSSEHPGDPFSIHQKNDALRIERHNMGGDGITRTAWFDVNGVFGEKEATFVTITLEKHETSVYINGFLKKVSPIPGETSNDLTGRLVIANSPIVHDSWPGSLLGLAIYHSPLKPAQVAQHFESWTRSQRPAVTQDQNPVALYLFNDEKGNICRNQVDSKNNLTIPEHYFVLHPALLSSPWHAYHATWSYWQDVAVNIGGFIPFGFCLIGCLASVRRLKRPAVITILFGFVTSLTIEALQMFLPTRDSDMTDVISNTIGTAIGVLLWRWLVAQRLLTMAWLQPRREPLEQMHA